MLMSKNKMLMIDLLLNKVLLANLSFIFFAQAKAPPWYLLNLKDGWRGDGRFILSCFAI
jgi:hypothetical protein